jgi:spoIIIJ-associated protein
MNSKEWVEIQAPTVEEAIILALTRLGITRDAASIEILDEGSQGFLGLGSKQARVKVKPLEQIPSAPVSDAEAPVIEKKPPVSQPESKPPSMEEPSEPEPPVEVVKPENTQVSRDEKSVDSTPPSVSEPVSESTAEGPSEDDPQKQIEVVVLDVARHLFGTLEVEPKIIWREEEKRPALWLSLMGVDAKSLVGDQGKTLNAAQFLTRVLVRNQIDGNFNLIVDANNYRWRHYKKLRHLATKTANKAVSSGQPIRMQPMPARQRRIVHMTLRKDQRVRTKSYGSGRGRAVTVFPVDK